MRMRGWIPGIVLAAFLAGCASPSPSPVVEPASTARANYEATFEAATETLRAYLFDIDLVDRRAGLITTFPMTGRSWLEFWRRDGATMWDITESTLQTIYRQAMVQVIAEGEGEYRVWVRVAVSRADRPSPRITNTSQAFQLFELERGRYRSRGSGPRHRRRDPVPLDDDLVLAMFIRRGIERRLAQR